MVELIQLAGCGAGPALVKVDFGERHGALYVCHLDSIRKLHTI
jgi:hypothetical protein